MKMNKEVVMVRISDIIPNRFQPRLTFDEEALNELANSIREHGIIQPLILRDLGSKYEIIAGERRYKASQIAGLTEVPAIVGTMDDQTSAELALIENIQRKDLSAIEEAKSYKVILDMGNFTQEELAKRMGKSQSTIANKMRLLTLTNEVQMALMNNLISERHARCLLQIKDEDKQKEVLNKIITERMNVRDTDDYIKNMLGIAKVDMPGLEKETVPASTPGLIEPKIDLPDMTAGIVNYGDSSMKIPTNEESIYKIPADMSKSEASANVKEPPKVEPLGRPIDAQDDNPNVYAGTNDNNFVNISSLNSEEPKVNPVKTALKDLDIVNNHSEVFSGNNVSVEERNVPVMPNVELQTINNQSSDLSKIKLATAIKLAKDASEEIKKAGYDVSVEEVDGNSDYQIIIKVQK